ncbi:hypothetical protein [Streptomyces sp. NPDC058268]|uniref:hypothetical protein n=1 Tax=Streptomyces sp. NPDC058268 TaxID=3346413 RepID=UPI0036E6C041
MVEPQAYEELYWRVRSRVLARHFAVGNRGRANWATTHNSLDPAVPGGVPDDARELVSRWHVTDFGGENPLLWSSRLLSFVAVEHQLGHPQAEHIATAALDTFDTLYKFEQDGPFGGYILRWDPEISALWSADGAYCEGFLIDPERQEYLHCTPHRDPRHVPTRDPGTLARLMSPQQILEYSELWNEHYRRYRVWEPSMDEIVGLVASYNVLFALVPTDAVRSRIVTQATRLAGYLAEHAYLLVRPEGGLTFRGSTGVLPAFEYSFNQVFRRITGSDHPARTDFVGAMQQTGYWRILQAPVERVATAIGIGNALVSPLLTGWLMSGDFVGQLLYHATQGLLSVAPPAVRAALPLLQPALPRSIGLYLHQDTFDVMQPWEPALANALMALPPDLRYRTFAQVMDLVPQQGLQIVRSFIPHLALTALDDADPLVREEYLRSMALRRQVPLQPGSTDLQNSCFASALALLHGMGPEEEPRLMELLDAHHQSLTAGAPEYLTLRDGVEEIDTALDYLAGLSLAWLYAKRRAEAGSPVTTPGFPQPPGAATDWPGVPLPGVVTTYLPHLARRVGAVAGTDVDLFDGPVTLSKPRSAPLDLPSTAGHVLVGQHRSFVKDTAGDVRTGVVLEPGDEFEITATGTILAPELFAQPSDANGWYAVDDARFPLHIGQDPVSARKYALLGRLGGYFFVGTHSPRRRFLYHRSLPLYLRVNIDNQQSAQGEGGFYAQIEVWGPPRYQGSAYFQAPEPIGAGANRQITVFLSNLGSAWDPADGYWLAPAPGTGQTWSAAPIPLTVPVPASSSTTLQVLVTAPAALGSYPMGWRLTGGPSGRLDISSSLHTVQVVTNRCAELFNLIAGLNDELNLLGKELEHADGEDRRSLERQVRKAENKLRKATEEFDGLGCPR